MPHPPCRGSSRGGSAFRRARTPPDRTDDLHALAGQGDIRRHSATHGLAGLVEGKLYGKLSYVMGKSRNTYDIWFPVSIFPQTNPWSHLTWGVPDYEMMAMSAPGQGISSKNIPKNGENRQPFFNGIQGVDPKKEKSTSEKFFLWPAGIKMIIYIYKYINPFICHVNREYSVSFPSPQMAKNGDDAEKLAILMMLRGLVNHSQKMWSSAGSSLTPNSRTKYKYQKGNQPWRWFRFTLW